MSDYTFKTDNTEDRVTLDPVYIKRVIQGSLNAHKVRRKNKAWSAEEVITACELYTSGFNTKEVAEAIDRPYITVNGKLNNVFGRRSGVYKMKNPACILHTENRMRNIVGEEMMTWDEVAEKQ